MTDFSAAMAARHLGVSERGLREQIRRGEVEVLAVDPHVRLDAQHVREALALQRAEILARLARKRQTAVSFALDVRARLHPRNPGPALPQYAEEDRERRVSLLPDDARRLFGHAVLVAASMPDDGSCRWCATARLARETPGWWAPAEFSEGFGALLGEPCGTCRPGLYGAVMERMRAHVHGGGKRRGDQRAAIRLAATVRSLEKDAAAVDGRRAVTASARPGTLKCGHRLDAGCSCPRRVSR